MSYDLNSRMDYVGSRMKEIYSELVAYHRGANSVSFLASYGKLRRKETDTTPIVSISEYFEFIFNAEDLIIDGDVVKPDRGDYIIRGNGERYELNAVRNPHNGSESLWTYTTPSQKRIRVYSIAFEE